MKTNVIMKVRFGDKNLTIGHKDKMGSLNELIEIGNGYRVSSGKEIVRMDKILELKGIKEYILMLENKVNSTVSTDDTYTSYKEGYEKGFKEGYAQGRRHGLE